VIRRSFRRGLGLGLLVGAVAAVVKMVQARRPGQGEIRVETYTGNAANEHFADASRQQERPLSDWEPTTPLPEPEETTPLTPEAVTDTPAPAPAPAPDPVPAPASAPVKKKAAPKKKAAAKSVDPVDGQCPDSHPVKGKLSSGLFHLPGGFAYPRTKPDRCYLDAAAAEADGLRAAKR
jgi:outer membrane biosynthesis protein TonB